MPSLSVAFSLAFSRRALAHAARALASGAGSVEGAPGRDRCVTSAELAASNGAVLLDLAGDDVALAATIFMSCVTAEAPPAVSSSAHGACKRWSAKPKFSRSTARSTGMSNDLSQHVAQDRHTRLGLAA
jgi:hypothetical protein